MLLDNASLLKVEEADDTYTGALTLSVDSGAQLVGLEAEVIVTVKLPMVT
jgi:hypothetical protein